MKQVRKWLESSARDHAAGVALFEAHGRSSVLKRLLSGPATDYTREVLARELTKLASECHATTSVIATQSPKKAPAALAAALKPPANPHEPTAEAEALRRQRRQLFSQRDYLHAQLELLPTEKQRLTASTNLLETVKLIQLSYDVAAGRVADPTPAPGPDLAALTDAGEIRRLLANLRPLRSKLKNRPDRADKLAEVEADIHLLEAKLKP